MYLPREVGLCTHERASGRRGARGTLFPLILLGVVAFPAVRPGWGAAGYGLQDEASQREAAGDAKTRILHEGRPEVERVVAAVGRKRKRPAMDPKQADQKAKADSLRE